MKWKLAESDNLDAILDMHQQIFDEELSTQDLAERSRDDQLHQFILSNSEDEQVGYAIVRGRERDAEYWLGGILPKWRRQGAGRALLHQLERRLADKGYSRMSATTFNHWRAMLKLLINMGYRIVGTSYSQRHDDLRIELHHELRAKRELRYALTERCNFDCIFCHNEGLSKEKRQPVAIEQVTAMLKKAVELEYTDITFTGGEPTLEKDRLKILIGAMAELQRPPDITLVTNGFLLDASIIQSLATYPGKAKIHLSLHAAEEDFFYQVTQTSAHKNIFQKVRDNIRAASAAGLTVKVNQVVLRKINHNQVQQAIDQARAMGAQTLKLIELLVLPGHQQDYDHYYSLDGLRPQIEELCLPGRSSNQRQQKFPLRDAPDFTIELQYCTCAMGCSHCLENRDKTLSSDLQYHPCFVRSAKHFSIAGPAQLQDVFAKGERIIQGYASRFGDKSPTLIQQAELESGRNEYFFAIDDLSALRKYIQDKKFSLQGIVDFDEHYYWPKQAEADWRDFHRVLKLRQDLYDTSKTYLIYSDHEFQDLGQDAYASKTKFLSAKEPLHFDSVEEGRHFLQRLNFEAIFSMHWKLEIWRYRGLEFSIAVETKRSTLRIVGSQTLMQEHMQVLADYPGTLQAVRQSIVKFMRA